MHHRVDRGDLQPALAEVSDVELDVGTLDPDERVQVVALGPGEPATQLVGVERVRVACVTGQVRDRRELRGSHRVGLERKECRVRHGCLRRSGDHAPPADRRTRRGHLNRRYARNVAELSDAGGSGLTHLTRRKDCEDRQSRATKARSPLRKSSDVCLTGAAPFSTHRRPVPAAQCAGCSEWLRPWTRDDSS